MKTGHMDASGLHRSGRLLRVAFGTTWRADQEKMAGEDWTLVFDHRRETGTAVGLGSKRHLDQDRHVPQRRHGEYRMTPDVEQSPSNSFGK